MPTIEQIIDVDRLTFDGVGSGNLLLICLLLFLGLHGAILLFTMSVCFMRRDQLARLLDPENFPKGSVWQERAATLLAWLELFARPEPASTTHLVSPRRSYQVTAQVATGDLCDVHQAVSEGRPYLLKMPRVSGCNDLLVKERSILKQLHERQDELYAEYFPVAADWFRSGRRVVSAFEWRAGFFSATELRERYHGGVDGRDLAWMFSRTLEALGFVHRVGWIHGAVLPQHLLFQPERQALQLLGWIHAVRRGKPLRLVSRTFKAWYPPECHRRETATPATDIYLAAKSLIWLAGGDPLTDSMPSELPIEIRSVLLECLLDTPGLRPQDAWTLHHRLGELLESVYGLPKLLSSRTVLH